MEQESFSIYNFSEALDNMMVGHDIARDDIRLRLIDGTIVMIDDKGDVLAPWLATHKDILAKDWRVIKLG